MLGGRGLQVGARGCVQTGGAACVAGRSWHLLAYISLGSDIQVKGKVQEGVGVGRAPKTKVGMHAPEISPRVQRGNKRTVCPQGEFDTHENICSQV